MNASNPVKEVESLLDRTIKCTLDDGRIVEGKLECLDRLKNIILKNATEYRIVDPSIYCRYPKSQQNEKEEVDFNHMTVERQLPLALIPGKHLVKVHLVKEEKGMGADIN